MFIYILKFNEYNYVKSLWVDEEAWITKKMRKWAFFYPFRSRQTKVRLKQKREEIQTNAKCKKIVKRKGRDKAKNQVKDKTQIKDKTKDKRKV